MNNVQAKVRCIANSSPQWSPDNDRTRIVRFTPVYVSDTSHPNYKWSEATPSGYLELTVTTPAAHGQFEVGKEYLVTFELDQDQTSA